jgi:broad specificity phosphatase PhoE
MSAPINIPKKIYLVRHAQSQANVTHDFQTLETPLSEKGREQSRLVAKSFESMGIDIILTSNATRAQQTAGEIGRVTGVPVEIFSDAQERIRPKSLEEKCENDDSVYDLEVLLQEYKSDPNKKYLDGESFYDIQLRAYQVLKILAERPEKKILLVTHGTFLKFLLLAANVQEQISPLELEMILSSFNTVNTGVSLFEYNPKEVFGSTKDWRVRFWNNYSHLNKED